MLRRRKISHDGEMLFTIQNFKINSLIFKEKIFSLI